eukprot:TRINITY_DN4265_c0_g6_i1.p1 TRINITY_DN4265_c0_g6~~TRINITY_DN4265_c0_g6_i1.p1  ORF type:complete len:277 (+),score=42.46 TRINITY_DN4265_c0_g6_i1:403-1233(+)
MSPFKGKNYGLIDQRTASIKEEFANQLKELTKFYIQKSSFRQIHRSSTRYTHKSHTPHKQQSLSQFSQHQLLPLHLNTDLSHSKDWSGEMVNASRCLKGDKGLGSSEEQYREIVMRKAGVLSSEQFAGKRAGESSQTGKFSLLKDSDLAGSFSVGLSVPSVTPPLKLLVPSLGKSTELRVRDSTPFISSKDSLQMQELQSSPTKEKVCRSTELDKSTHNLYEKYSVAMEKGGVFGSNWYIPVQRADGKFISLEGFELELHKSYTVPIQITKGYLLY